MTDSTVTSQPIPPALRQCGRCRLFFPTGEGFHPAELKEWWACDDCSTRIIPSHQRTPTTNGVPRSD